MRPKPLGDLNDRDRWKVWDNRKKTREGLEIKVNTLLFDPERCICVVVADAGEFGDHALNCNAVKTLLLRDSQWFNGKKCDCYVVFGTIENGIIHYDSSFVYTPNQVARYLKSKHKGWQDREYVWASPFLDKPFGKMAPPPVFFPARRIVVELRMENWI